MRTQAALIELANARIASQEIDKARKLQVHWADERARHVEAALKEGITRTEVAEELGISAQAVSAMLKRLSPHTKKGSRHTHEDGTEHSHAGGWKIHTHSKSHAGEIT